MLQKTVGNLPCAFPFVMKHSLGNVVVLVAGFDESVGEIDVFSIHEEVFVQESDLLQSIVSHQHERPAQYIHLMHLVRREIG